MRERVQRRYEQEISQLVLMCQVGVISRECASDEINLICERQLRNLHKALARAEWLASIGREDER